MPKRRASRQVTLAISGALSFAAVSGCDPGPEPTLPLEYQPLTGTNASATPVTNNTYQPSRGYYHAGSHTFFPYPYGHRDPARGFFYDGQWQNAARTTPPDMEASTPNRVARVAPATTTSHRSSGSSSSSSHTVSRGGFGSFGHSATS